MHIIHLGDIHAFFIEIFYVLEGEKKNMPSNKQLNSTVFMEDHHVVKDVGHWEKMPSWRIYKEHQWDEASKNVLAHHSLP